MWGNTNSTTVGDTETSNNHREAQLLWLISTVTDFSMKLLPLRLIASMCRLRLDQGSGEWEGEYFDDNAVEDDYTDFAKEFFEVQTQDKQLDRWENKMKDERKMMLWIRWWKFSKRKTALQSHYLWSWRPFFVGFGDESQRSKFEQEHSEADGWVWPKNLECRRRGRYCVTGARRQEFEAVESWIRPGVMDLLRQNAYELIPADHEYFESLAWSCMIARWHHWRHKRSYVPIFSPSVWPSSCPNFDLGLSPLNSQNCQIRAYDFGVQFSLKKKKKKDSQPTMVASDQSNATGVSFEKSWWNSPTEWISPMMFILAKVERMQNKLCDITTCLTMNGCCGETFGQERVNL